MAFSGRASLRNGCCCRDRSTETYRTYPRRTMERRPPVKARSVACVVALLSAMGGASMTNAATAAGGHDVSLTTIEQGRWGLWSQPALLGAASACEWQTEMDQLASQGG